MLGRQDNKKKTEVLIDFAYYRASPLENGLLDIFIVR